MTLRKISHNGTNGNALVEIGEDVTEAHPYKQNGHATEKVAKKVDWEIPRKTLHASIGFLVIPLYTHGYNARPVIIVLSGALAIISAADALRLHNVAFARFYESCLGFLMRESERDKVNGVIWYILGVLITLSVFPLDVSVVCILILSWADTAASTFGRLWGRYTRPLPSRLPLLPFLPASLRSRLSLPMARQKSLAGFIAASVTAGAVALGFWGWLAPVRHSEATWNWDDDVLGGWIGLGLLSVATGLIAGVAEALDLGSLDDNLTLPVISGGILWAFLRGIRSLF